jgi:hypothetical protein
LVLYSYNPHDGGRNGAMRTIEASDGGLLSDSRRDSPSSWLLCIDIAWKKSHVSVYRVEGSEICRKIPRKQVS